MKKITSWKDTAYVEHNVLDRKLCEEYIEKAQHPSEEIRKSWSMENQCWEERTVNIMGDPIILKVKKIICEHLNKDLELTRAQIQTWMVGTSSTLHVHKGDPSTWNTVLYLNDDFEGGFFYTKNGLVIKPEPGLLTLFNGQKVFHGVGEVKKNYRFSLIFWWKQ